MRPLTHLGDALHCARAAHEQTRALPRHVLSLSHRGSATGGPRFPGLYDAALRVRARAFTDAMLVAAAGALAAAAPAGQLLPEPLDVTVHERVSRSVQVVVIGAAPAGALGRNGGDSCSTRKKPLDIQ